MRRALLCVVTGRYLPMALAMATSYSKYHPSDAIRVLLVDVSSAAARQIQVPGWSDLRIDGIDALDKERVARMRNYYHAIEMIGATRSAYIRKVLRDEGFEQLIMLDADICCYRELTPFLGALKDASIALTPHMNSPVPQNGTLPDDLEFVRCGFINNGCFAVRHCEEAWPVLEWLESKVEKNCFVCPEINLNNEQTWVSFLPWYFPEQVRLVRDPGMNVAYWNLHERRLRAGDEGYEVNGSPLYFFHFSGYDSSRHPALTVHSNRSGDAESMKTVAVLLEQYRDALSAAFRRYPQPEADMPCSTLDLGQRLRIYREMWGESPSFLADYKRFARYDMRRHVRSLVRRFAATALGPSIAARGAKMKG